MLGRLSQRRDTGSSRLSNSPGQRRKPMKALNRIEVVALRGLRLPSAAIKGLQRAGIYSQPAISIEFQQQARCYVIRGIESGGAVPRLGAYCAFVNVRGGSLATVQLVATVAVNGIHAAILSPEFIRVQIFRFELYCELLLTRHTLASRESKIRPTLSNSVLFHGVHGRLEFDLWDKDSRLRGMVVPTFYSKSGEQIVPPDHFHDAVLRATTGACCVGCRHAHVSGSVSAIGGEQPL